MRFTVTGADPYFAQGEVVRALFIADCKAGPQLWVEGTPYAWGQRRVNPVELSNLAPLDGAA